MYKLNIRYKLILLLFFSFIGLIVILGTIIYVSLTNHLYTDFYRVLEKRAAVVANAEIEGKGLNAEYDLRLVDLTDKLKDPQDYVYEVGLHDHESLAEKMELPVGFFLDMRDQGKAHYRNDNILYSGILYTKEDRHYYVISSAESYFEGRLVSYLQRTLLTAVGIFALIAMFLSIYVSKYIFKPINRITDKVQQISTENLHLRLDEEKNNEELNHLIGTFNDMLDRIETAFETQNNFISNASHELRTPLTGIIGTADVCLSRTRSPEEYIETLTVILEEAAKLDRKTKVLLSLAHTGFDGKVQKFDKVRMDQLLWDAKESIEKLDQKNKIHFDTGLLPENSLKLKVIGNEQLLLLAFTNIINNACKYSNHQVVNLSIGASNDKVFIIVKDTGIGIPKEELEFIYNLFYRASNTKNFEGFGIGLPLTRNIIKMHHGEMHISSVENVGTTVQIVFPIAKITDNPTKSEN